MKNKSKSVKKPMPMVESKPMKKGKKAPKAKKEAC